MNRSLEVNSLFDKNIFVGDRAGGHVGSEQLIRIQSPGVGADTVQKASIEANQFNRNDIYNSFSAFAGRDNRVKTQNNRSCQEVVGEGNRRLEEPITKLHETQKWKPDEGYGGYSEVGIMVQQQHRSDVWNRNTPTYESEGDQAIDFQSSDKFLSREESRWSEQPRHKDTPLDPAHDQPSLFSRKWRYTPRNKTMGEARITQWTTKSRSHSRWLVVRGSQPSMERDKGRRNSRMDGGSDNTWRCYLCGTPGHTVVKCPDLEEARMALHEKRSTGGRGYRERRSKLKTE